MGGFCGSGTSPSDASAPEALSDTPIDFKPIHSAVRWNKPVDEIEELLLTEAHVNSQDVGNGNFPIHIAAQNGHLDTLKLLVRKNANLNALNHKLNTAVHMAIGYDYYICAKFLIDSGADQTLRNSDGFIGSYGLEGNKCLGLAAFYNADNHESVTAALKILHDQKDDLKKIGSISTTPKSTLVQVIMKLKKLNTSDNIVLSPENEKSARELIHIL